jgi:hypothetical protein
LSLGSKILKIGVRGPSFSQPDGRRLKLIGFGYEVSHGGSMLLMGILRQGLSPLGVLNSARAPAGRGLTDACGALKAAGR